MGAGKPEPGRVVPICSAAVAALALTAGAAPAGGEAPAYALIHYLRDAGDYGDHSSGNFNDYWGLHLWGSGLHPSEVTVWQQPRPFLGEDAYGRFAWIRLAPGGGNVNFIIHRGDAKDTDSDRGFDATLTPRVWVRQGEEPVYRSAAAARGRAIIRYRRPIGDYGDYTSNDFNDFWGLHLWGEALAPAELTEWTEPKRATGFDGFGALFDVQLRDSSAKLHFIIHRGDAGDPSVAARSFVPDAVPEAWLQSGEEPVYRERGAATGVVTLHYHRPAGDYGDPSSPDFNDFWGLHVWTGALTPTTWLQPVRPAAFDAFGATYPVALAAGASTLAYILHRGSLKDPGPDQFLDLGASGYEVWQLQGADVASPYVLPLPAAQRDIDGDGRPWFADNCIAVANAGQRDTDADGLGNACDADIAPQPNDCVVSFVDLAALKEAFFTTPADAPWNPDADFNGDDAVNFGDLAVMRAGFFAPPGPSGLPSACD